MRKWTWTTPKPAALGRHPHAQSFPCRYTSLALSSGIRSRNGSTTAASSPVENAELMHSHEDEARRLRSRHLFRAILRECTYLPDSVARQWAQQHAFERFRTYDFKSWEHRNDVDFGLRLRAKEKEVRSWVAYLKRANEGERKCLMRVLFMAYGRIGKRRHELMLPLLAKAAEDESGAVDTDWSDVEEAPVPDVHPAPENASKPPVSRTSDMLKIEPPLTPPLRALLQSQMRASPPALSRPNPRRVTGSIAALNAWLRPMPQKRVENMRKKHYAELLNRILPPLPTEEWQRLRDLATGRIESERPRQRRSKSSEHVDRCHSLEAIVSFGKAPMKLLETHNGHAITPRYMRRLYAQVFSQCPLLDWDVASSSWRVTWGEEALRGGVSNPVSPQRTSP